MITSKNELKQFLDIDLSDTANDNLILSVLKVADLRVKNYLRYNPEAVVSVSETLWVGKSRFVGLYHAPITTVISIKDNAGSSFDSDDYRIAEKGIVEFFNAISATTVEVTYSGGYTQATMPEDLKMAAWIIAEALYNRRGSFGAKKENFSSFSTEYQDDIPPDAKSILKDYRRVLL